MKKYIGIITLLCFFFSKCYAATGTATVYKVTMKKVELCKVLDCSNSTTVGTGSQTIDIASLTAGAAAAAFASTTGLPFGTTYQFLRVTLNRSFILSGSVGGLGGQTCYTDGDAAGTATALHTGSTTAGDLAETTLFISDVGSYGNDSSIEMSYSALEGDIIYAKRLILTSATEMTVTYQLTSPYTVGLIAPRIKIVFNTSKAQGAGRDGAGNCLMWPAEPYVSISITE